MATVGVVWEGVYWLACTADYQLIVDLVHHKRTKQVNWSKIKDTVDGPLGPLGPLAQTILHRNQYLNLLCHNIKHFFFSTIGTIEFKLFAAFLHLLLLEEDHIY